MKRFFKGALLLTLGGFVCKFIGAFYRIPLSNILGSSGMGYYQMIFPIYSFALVFVSGGIPATLSRFISLARARNNKSEIRDYFLIGLLLSFIIGILFCLLFLIFAKKLAVIQGNEKIFSGYYIIAITIIFSSLLCAFRGLFQGYENMTPTFISQIFEQLFKLLFGLVFATYFMKYGAEYGFLGALIGIAFSEFLTFLYLIIYFYIFNKKNSLFDSKIKFNFKYKDFYVYNFPLTLTALIIPLINAVGSLIIVNLLVKHGLTTSVSTSIYGIQTGMINSIISFPTVISTALATCLIPSISFFCEKGDSIQITNSIKSCFKVIWILSLPCMIGLFALAPNVLKIAFENAIPIELFDVAVDMMKITSLSVLFISLVQITTVILQALKKQWQAFISLFILAFGNFLLLIILIKTNSIYGIALSSLFAYALCSVINLILITNKISINMKIKDLLIPFFSAIFMGFICIYLNNLFKNINIVISSIFIVIFAIIFYFSSLFLFKILKINELKIKINKNS